MIQKIGIDITCNKRYKVFIKTNKLDKILSSKEIVIYNQITNDSRKIEYIASRFASKEALYKAYGKTFSFNEVSVLNKEDGTPYFEAEFLKELIVFLSISHEKDNSIAFVIIERA